MYPGKLAVNVDSSQEAQQHVAIKPTGAAWPRLGLGTWKTQPASAVTAIVHDAIKVGYRHLDCAAQYGNEKDVGLGIKRAIEEGCVERKDLWVTSKLWNTDHAPEHVEEACLRTLKDLQLDYLDLYLIHFPVPLEYVDPKIKYPAEFFNDPNNPHVKLSKIPLSVTWAAMERLVDRGLVKHIGVSNFDLQLLQDLLTYCRIPPITNQIELHPYLQQIPMVRFCEKIGITVTAYSPFGGKSYESLGMVKPKELHVLNHPVLQEIAQKHQRSIAQVILRWLVQRSPNLVVIPKTASLEHARQNFDVYSFTLEPSEMDQIAALNCGRRYNDVAIYTDKHDSYWPIFA